MRIPRKLVLVLSILMLMALGPPVGAGSVDFHAYRVRTVPADSGPTTLTFTINFDCSGAQHFSVHLWIYSFENGQTVWNKTARHDFQGDARPRFTFRAQERLARGQYLVASSNALCWAGSRSQGVGQRGLRCWETFEVTATRAIRGDSFAGEDCTEGF